MQIRPLPPIIFQYTFSGMPGKHPDTLQVESFSLKFCAGSTPTRYNLTRLYFRKRNMSEVYYVTLYYILHCILHIILSK